MTLTEVRKQLRAVRLAKGYSQDEVAEDADVSQATVSRLEAVDTEMAEVEFETIRKIVEQGLQVRLSEFFRHIDSPAAKSVHSEHPPLGQAVSGDTHAATLPAALPHNQLEIAYRAALRALETYSREFGPDRRSAAGVSDRSAETDARRRTHGPRAARRKKTRRSER